MPNFEKPNFLLLGKLFVLLLSLFVLLCLLILCLNDEWTTIMTVLYHHTSIVLLCVDIVVSDKTLLELMNQVLLLM